MRFVLFKGQGQYGSLRLHVDQLALALEGLGHPAQIIDLTDAQALADLNASLGAPPDVYLSLSGIGSDIQGQGRSIYDQVGCLYASIYVDHPVHHLPRLMAPIARQAAFFLDRSHVQFMTSWSRGRAFAQLGFLPPGANQLEPAPDLSDEAFARRDIPLLFTGTYRGPPARPWRAEPDTPARTAMDALADVMAADARLPVAEALKLALKSAFGAELTPQLFEEFLPLLQAPQAFAEAYHRDRLLRILGAAGTPVTVYGLGWAPLAEAFPSFQWGGEGSFAETLHLLRRARLVLNINNGFVAGGHERVFTAMAAGAAVISDDNKYYSEAFKSGREIALFPWPKAAGLPDQIAGLLDDGPGLAVLARAGARKVLADHTWTSRAARLVKSLKQAS